MLSWGYGRPPKLSIYIRSSHVANNKPVADMRHIVAEIHTPDLSPTPASEINELRIFTNLRLISCTFAPWREKEEGCERRASMAGWAQYGVGFGGGERGGGSVDDFCRRSRWNRSERRQDPLAHALMYKNPGE